MSTLYIANTSCHHEADLRYRLPGKGRGVSQTKIDRFSQTSLSDTPENVAVIVSQLRPYGVIKVGEPLPREFKGLYYDIDHEIDIGSLGVVKGGEVIGARPAPAT